MRLASLLHCMDINNRPIDGMHLNV